MSVETKAAVTVAEMARMVGLSRARFYQLLGTAFPLPIYDVTTRRPYFVEEAQKVCLEVRRRNCGINGKPILFYCRRVPIFDWLVQQSHVDLNPAKAVKELRRQPLAPKGLDRAEVRRLLREIELREDVRSTAIFSLMLYTGCRVSDLVNLELPDLLMTDRSGSVVFRHGKGNKQRTVPLPLIARRAMQSYIDTRSPIDSMSVFIGERGPMTDCGVRALCRKYSVVIGVRLHPHVFRHTFAKQFLADNNNDLVSLAQILGHESLSTTSRYSGRNELQLSNASERLAY